MAFGEFSLGIPAGTPISTLTLRDFNGEFGFPRRSRLGFAGVDTISNWGTASVIGPAYNYRYIWQCVFNLSAEDALHLRALVNWQDRQFKSGASGELLWRDHLHKLDPEPSPHSKTFVSGTSESWAGASGYVTGYGEFTAVVQIAEDFEQRYTWAGGEVLTFTVREV